MPLVVPTHTQAGTHAHPHTHTNANRQQVRIKFRWDHAGSSTANKQMRIHKGDVFKYKHADMYNVLYTHLNIRFFFSFNEKYGHESDNKIGTLTWTKDILFCLCSNIPIEHNWNCFISSTHWQTIFFLALTIIIIHDYNHLHDVFTHLTWANVRFNLNV